MAQAKHLVRQAIPDVGGKTWAERPCLGAPASSGLQAGSRHSQQVARSMTTPGNIAPVGKIVDPRMRNFGIVYLESMHLRENLENHTSVESKSWISERLSF